MTTQNAFTSIALVDDHALFRSSLQTMLTIWGYRVTLQAVNGQDLLDQLNSNNVPDICIVDLNMPGMSGHETIRQLKARWPGIKIMIYSLDVSIEKPKVPLFGAEAMISKMANLTQLKITLQQLSPKQPVPAT